LAWRNNHRRRRLERSSPQRQAVVQDVAPADLAAEPGKVVAVDVDLPSIRSQPGPGSSAVAAAVAIA
jgi:hypothetical protein